jgi:hypothetical protein
MVISRVLWGFDITWPVDKDGKRLEQDIMPMVYGFLSTPQEFKASFTPRSEKHARIYRQEWAGTSSQHKLLTPTAAQKEGIKFVHLKQSR